MSRTSNGESSIYQAADGRWHGYVSMGAKRNGQRDRRHVTGRRRSDVARKVRALEDVRDAEWCLREARLPLPHSGSCTGSRQWPCRG